LLLSLLFVQLHPYLHILAVFVLLFFRLFVQDSLLLFLSGQLCKTFVGDALLKHEFLFLTFYLHFVLDLYLLELLCLFCSSFSRRLLF
jgi:hypothetical protein